MLAVLLVTYNAISAIVTLVVGRVGTPFELPAPGAEFSGVMPFVARIIAAAPVATLVLSVFAAVGWGAATLGDDAVGGGTPRAAGRRPALRRPPYSSGVGLEAAGRLDRPRHHVVCCRAATRSSRCLAPSVAVFERRNPIVRSFSMTHARFGPVLGRTVSGIFLLVVTWEPPRRPVSRPSWKGPSSPEPLALDRAEC